MSDRKSKIIIISTYKQNVTKINILKSKLQHHDDLIIVYNVTSSIDTFNISSVT